MSFGLRHVAPALPEFLAAYPEVSIDLQLDDRMVDLVAGGIDVALRIADLPDSSLIARRLCPVQRWVVGTPAYFARRGTPQHPLDLQNHACLGYSYLMCGEIWRFKDANGAEEVIQVNARLNANNAEALCASLDAGEGIALQPDFIAWQSVKTGRLIPVLINWSTPPLALNLVTPAGGPRAIRTRALLDFLTHRFCDWFGAMDGHVADGLVGLLARFRRGIAGCPSSRRSASRCSGNRQVSHPSSIGSVSVRRQRTGSVPLRPLAWDSSP